MQITTSIGQRGAADWAQLATNEIISVADTAPPAIKDQALAFQAGVLAVVQNYITMAVQEERAYDALLVEQAGHADVASAIRGR